MTDAPGRGDRDHPHLLVPSQPTTEPFRRRAGGGPGAAPYVITDRGAHAAALRVGLERALRTGENEREQWPNELRSQGIVLAVEGWPDGFELALESLDLRRSGIELLSVRSSLGTSPELATVFVPDDKAPLFFRRLEQYAEQQTRGGRPRNEALVANIQVLRLAALEQFWTESSPFPEGNDRMWWELWLRRTRDELDVLRQLANRFDWSLAERPVEFPGRTITAVEGRASELSASLGSRLPIAELRRPRLIQAPLELPLHIQQGWVDDLARRLRPAGDDAPAVCLLDTGIYQHTLFQGSLEPADVQYVVGVDGIDRRGHGTALGGLALFADLTDALTSSLTVSLEHRLESVKVLPDPGAPANPPETYAAVTAAGSVAPETAHPRRRRVYCIANSRHDHPSDGRPTSWSATIDALSFGTDVESSDEGIELLSDPDPEASRLFIVAAGNVRDFDRRDFLDVCDTSAVEDPGQAWNAVTAGAFTRLHEVPDDPTYDGYTPLAEPGELSPFSRTSLTFSDLWPMKPDVVLEGGNVLASEEATRFDWPETVSLTTTSRREPDGQPLTTTNATSAAAAQAARLAAMASARYPSLWPETLRGLLVHSAEWTDAMRAAFTAAGTDARRRRLVRRYGFGVPTATRVLQSASAAVTLIAQSTLRPFEFVETTARLREMTLHELPWPRDQLMELGEVQVRLRVTLSYFIEPNPSARGWRGRYVYPSHGLRFDIRRPSETLEEFRRRLNRLAEVEEGGGPVQPGQGPDWVIGPRGRSFGSLHGDLWTGTAAELANCGMLGVYPVGGWWKHNNRIERLGIPVRYALLVSLRAPEVGVDLYTPIATQIGVPIPINAS